MTYNEAVDWIEKEWGKTKPEIENDKQNTIQDFAINKTPGIKNKGFKRVVEIKLDELKIKAKPYINKTNDKYFRRMETKIRMEGIDVKQLGRLRSQLSDEYDIAFPKLQSIIDKQEETARQQEEKEMEKRIARETEKYIQAGISREEAEKIAMVGER